MFFVTWRVHQQIIIRKDVPENYKVYLMLLVCARLQALEVWVLREIFNFLIYFFYFQERERERGRKRAREGKVEREGLKQAPCSIP